MLQNTAQLPANLVNELKNSLTRLANLSSTLRTQRGDIVAPGEIFTKLFPEQALFGTLAGASPEQMEEASRRYREEWDKWAQSVDQASQATFQLSGQQLADLQRDPARFQSYIDELLSTPDGQQKAIMAPGPGSPATAGADGDTDAVPALQPDESGEGKPDVGGSLARNHQDGQDRQG